MKEQAIAKIKAEMEANKKNSVIVTVCELLIKRLEILPKDALAIMEDKKTVKGAVDEMASVARKRGGGWVAMTDAEGMEIVCRYFGLDPEAERDIPAPAPKARDPFDVSLDDLLAGG